MTAGKEDHGLGPIEIQIIRTSAPTAIRGCVSTPRVARSCIGSKVVVGLSKVYENGVGRK